MMRQPHHVLSNEPVVIVSATIPAIADKRCRSKKLIPTPSTSSCSSSSSSSDDSSAPVRCAKTKVATTRKKTTTTTTRAATVSASSRVPVTSKASTAASNTNVTTAAAASPTSSPKRTKKIIRVVRKKVIKKKKKQPNHEESNNDTAATTTTTPDAKPVKTLSKQALAALKPNAVKKTVKVNKKKPALKSCLKKTTKPGTMNHKTKVSFASTLSTARLIETLQEWYQKPSSLSQWDPAAYWYSDWEMNVLKRDAQDDAEYWEHKAVAAAWQTKAPLTNANHYSIKANNNSKDTVLAMQAQEALRGLEGHTTEGHWNAYKARKDICNAILDAQDEQRKRGGWRRNKSMSHSPTAAAATHTMDVVLAQTSLALSAEAAKEARARGAWDAQQAGH